MRGVSFVAPHRTIAALLDGFAEDPMQSKDRPEKRLAEVTDVLLPPPIDPVQIVAVATSDVADAAFDALVEHFGDRARVAMTVMFCESSFHANRPNGSGAAYYGLNQMGVAELRALGLTPLQWLSMPAERQIPYVAHFWNAKVGRFGDWIWERPEHLYGCNFLPGRCSPGMPRDRPLTHQGDHDYQTQARDPQTGALSFDEAGNKVLVWRSFYESNTGLDIVAGHLDADGHHRYDVGKDGAIDLEDLAAWVELRKKQEPKRWGELDARLSAAASRVGA